uniref:ANK_REP_REGION domain-containing protein n=1 Tax=Echinostoma caproni TaxID=27848 RepID=A0A183AJ73_9TREM
LESPEVLAQCALNAPGPYGRILTENGLPDRPRLTAQQKIFQLLLDCISQIAEKEQRDAIVNFRETPDNPESPTILHRLIAAHSDRYDLTWSIDQLMRAGADPLIKANLHDNRGSEVSRLSCLQQAACSIDFVRLLPILLQSLNMKHVTVRSHLEERFFYAGRSMCVREQLDALSQFDGLTPGSISVAKNSSLLHTITPVPATSIFLVDLAGISCECGQLQC